MTSETSETSSSKSAEEVAATTSTIPSAGLIGQAGFSALLIAFAVFPAALGVGVASYSAAPIAGKLPESEIHPVSLPNQIDAGSAKVDAAQFDLVRGDDLLRDERYAAALHFYRSLESTDSLPLPGKIVVRIAMCQEGLGRFDEALAGYRKVASGTDPVLAAAAVLGQARVWMRLHDGKQAEPLLRSLLLNCGHRNVIPAPMAEEVAYLFTLALSEQLLNEMQPSPVAGFVPTQQVLDWPFDQLLAWIDSRPPHRELDSAADNQVSEQVRQVSEQVPNLEVHRPQRDAVTPQASGGLGEPVRISAHQRPLAELLQCLASEFQLQLVWSDELRLRATERSLNVSFSEFPATLLISALCRELNAIWVLDEGTQTLAVASIGDEQNNTDKRSSGIL